MRLGLCDVEQGVTRLTDRGGRVKYSVEDAEKMIYSTKLNRVSALLAVAAVRRDKADISWVNSRVGVVNTLGKIFLIDGAINNESVVGSLIVDDKELARGFFLDRGVRTPQGRMAANAAEAVAFARTLDRPVVVKPRIGAAGKGVTVDLTEESDIVAAFDHAAARGRGVLVEECLSFTSEYRCIVTPSTCLAVVKRVLPRVVGDGRSTVEDLIDAKNLERRRNPMLERIPIPKDRVVDAVLGGQALTRASVVDVGREVLVRNVGGLSGGGEPHEVSDTVDPRIKEIAIAAAAAIPGLGWAGVDVVLDSVMEVPYVLEANINAGYGGATFPVAGEPQDVAGAAWAIRREQGSRSDQPLEDVAPVALSEPRTVRDELAAMLPEGASAPLIGEVMRAVLEDDGWSIQTHGKVFEAHDGRGAVLWFIRSGGSTKDALGPRRMLRRHHLVRRFLARAKIRRPTGLLTSDVTGFRRMFGQSRNRIAAMPKGSAWAGSEMHRVRPSQGAELLSNTGGAWFFQALLPGVRVRLFAHRDAVLWVTTADQRAEISSEAIDAASQLAIRSVRAIPELRWAVVEVVIRRSEGVGEAPRVMVEGLLPNPGLVHDHRVLAGSVRSFVRWLAESAAPGAG